MPLGKLGTEPHVPLDARAVTALDAEPPSADRSVRVPIRSGAATNFLLAKHGRRLES